MEQEKLELLRERHPKLDLPLCECGDGWFEILDKLCTRLDALELPKTFCVLQIKEKVGELRFYVNGASDPVKDLQAMRWISEAMGESIHVCEVCGRSGRRRQLSWVQTLCWWHYLLRKLVKR